jgi:hypothetical protein
MPPPNPPSYRTRTDAQRRPSFRPPANLGHNYKRPAFHANSHRAAFSAARTRLESPSQRQEGMPWDPNRKPGHKSRHEIQTDDLLNPEAAIPTHEQPALTLNIPMVVIPLSNTNAIYCFLFPAEKLFRGCCPQSAAALSGRVFRIVALLVEFGHRPRGRSVHHRREAAKSSASALPASTV